MASLAMINNNNAEYDRAKELKQFDESKKGVKGLVDSGVTAIPKFFVHPPEVLSELKRGSNSISVSIPVIDLSDRRSAIVDRIRSAAREWGFFQVINHGIPREAINRTMAAIKAFHEQPTEIKSRFYTRDTSSAVWYVSNVDLYRSKAAFWNDTLQVRLGPNPPAPEQMPEICMKELEDWDKEAVRLGEKLMGFMCEGLGLSTDRLKEISCSQGRSMLCHYYSPCPQPHLTLGANSHTDSGVLTVLIQDQTGGLQVKYGELWVDVKPVEGAIVINVGDLLQILSNDEYKSVDHRVLANPTSKPRISIATFLRPSKTEDIYGPLPELITPEKPALFRQFKLSDYFRTFFTKAMKGKTLVNYYRADETDD
ncbi:hypothetical protein FNV43_RR26862 [Rhamnella rubrinervis]|uniref:Fe2OG dioxygenase domain-containing protein n=1 Tax=Rhamnella rubrinervis TaxID=2594499 RepID=A0A8K0DQ46_9ROSA|nr:hypothetical protein FNV43_RR26862 [Rhamnella rubrinervis]